MVFLIKRYQSTYLNWASRKCWSMVSKRPALCIANTDLIACSLLFCSWVPWEGSSSIRKRPSWRVLRGPFLRTRSSDWWAKTRLLLTYSKRSTRESRSSIIWLAEASAIIGSNALCTWRVWLTVESNSQAGIYRTWTCIISIGWYSNIGRRSWRGKLIY